jgi:riboflavin synthase
VRARRADAFLVDAVAATLERTTLSEARPGRSVHLERALRLGDRLGGHLVLGHVDAVVRVRSVTRSGDDRRVRVGLEPEIRRFVAARGSVALSGVSLTVAALDPDAFEVVLVPHTLAATCFGSLAPGDRLNLEADLVARYLERLVDPHLAGPPPAGGGGESRRRDHG